MCRAGHRAHDDRVEEEAELALLLGHLVGPAREPEPAERVVRRAGGDRVRLSTALLDGRERVLPALADPDVESSRIEPHVGAHDPREEDVADLVVDGVGPLDPVLLDEHAAQAETRGDRRDLARVVGLHATDRHERVAALREGLGHEVLELADLVAPVGEARVAVLALGPDLHLASEVLLEALEPMDRRRPERQRDPLEVGEAHRRDVNAPSCAVRPCPTGRP